MVEYTCSVMRSSGQHGRASREHTGPGVEPVEAEVLWMPSRPSWEF